MTVQEKFSNQVWPIVCHGYSTESEDPVGLLSVTVLSHDMAVVFSSDFEDKADGNAGKPFECRIRQISRLLLINKVSVSKGQHQLDRFLGL